MTIKEQVLETYKVKLEHYRKQLIASDQKINEEEAINNQLGEHYDELVQTINRVKKEIADD